MVAGRQSVRAGWGVLAVTEPGDEDQVREGKGVPDQIEVRGKEDQNEITTFRRCRLYRTVIQGGSAIPGSRATGATTSTITRDCDRPIHEGKGFADRANAKRDSEAGAGKGRESKREAPTTRLPKQQEDQKGIRGERGAGSIILLGKRAIRRGERGWILTMNTHGVDFSIARGVEEIVLDPNPMSFFFLFFFFFSFFSHMLNFVSS